MVNEYSFILLFKIFFLTEVLHIKNTFWFEKFRVYSFRIAKPI